MEEFEIFALCAIIISILIYAVIYILRCIRVERYVESKKQRYISQITAGQIYYNDESDPVYVVEVSPTREHIKYTTSEKSRVCNLMNIERMYNKGYKLSSDTFNPSEILKVIHLIYNPDKNFVKILDK